MVILLTGGAGFIGSAIARKLLEVGHDVRILDIMRHGDAHDVPEGAKLIEGDVCDPTLVHGAAKGADFILHLASIAGVGTVNANPIRTMRVGFEGVRNVLEAAGDQHVRGVLCFSSSEVCGVRTADVAETEPTPVPAPSDVRWGYAAIKLAAEHLAYAYHTRGVPAATFRIFNTYGPGQLGEGAVRNFVRACATGEPLVVRQGGVSIRSWCYVEDVVAATLRAIERMSAVSGEVINIGNPDTVRTTLELAKLVRMLWGEAAPPIIFESGTTDVHVRVPNIKKATKLLGWTPYVGLEDGLMRTMEAYR